MSDTTTAHDKIVDALTSAYKCAANAPAWSMFAYYTIKAAVLAILDVAGAIREQTDVQRELYYDWWRQQ